MSTLEEAKKYLHRHGWATDTAVDPVDLLRDVVVEYEQLQAHSKKLAERIVDQQLAL